MKMTENNSMTTEFDIGKFLKDYTPYIRKTARKYVRPGAEFDDLVQEAYLAVLAMPAQCPKTEYLVWFMLHRLPGALFKAAEKMCGGGLETSGLEGLEDVLADDGFSVRREESELQDMLSRALTPDELALVQALASGFTREEYAREIGVSHQAVGKRLQTIRIKLDGVLKVK